MTRILADLRHRCEAAGQRRGLGFRHRHAELGEGTLFAGRRSLGIAGKGQAGRLALACSVSNSVKAISPRPA